MKYAVGSMVVLAICILAAILLTRLISRHNRLRRGMRWLSAILMTVGFAGVAMLAYLSVYSHADASVEQYLQSSDTVTVSKAANGWYFDGPGTESAIVFYPGAKIQETAYAPLLHQLAEDGTDCFLVKMPFRIAFFGINAADEVISSYPHDHWYMMGHSLGGSAAALYAADHSGAQAGQKDENEAASGSSICGLILLASYSTEDLNIPVLSVYGSNDGVLEMDQYNAAKSHWLAGGTELVIEGGNHAGFADYGRQSGDGEATISAGEQQRQTAHAIRRFVSE